jgi:hypothetical protein
LALLGPAPGAPTRSRLDLIHEERLGLWVELASPPELRQLRERLVPLILADIEPPSEPELEVVLRPLRWLLEACRDGVTLTQAGYLPTMLVREALERFDWWPDYLLAPRSESDLFQLAELRDVARRVRLLTKRGRRLTTSRAALRLIDDRQALWRAVAPVLGRDSEHGSEFTGLLAELVGHVLLSGPAGDDELSAAIGPVVERQGWRRGRLRVMAEQVRWDAHIPLREWRLFSLLEEQTSSWRQGEELRPWRLALTPAGRQTILFQLRAAAIGPRNGW